MRRLTSILLILLFLFNFSKGVFAEQNGLILTMPNLLPSEPYAEIIYESVKKPITIMMLRLLLNL